MTYRYRLSRDLEPDLFAARGPRAIGWIMLNPSTADDVEDDNTIRRLRSFSAREGASRLLVRNVFAYRATDPGDLKAAALADIDVVGPENLAAIAELDSEAGLIVVAWGDNVCDRALRRRARPVLEAIAGLSAPKVALGFSKGRGQPLHPLYQPGDAQLVPWPRS